MKYIPIILIVALLGCKKKTMHTEVNNETVDSIQFAGYTWLVKNAPSPIGPGPNIWNSKNVWVDDRGRLHLRIHKEPTGVWTCAEVYTQKVFGYGTYQWWIEGVLATVDQNVVLGLFMYSGHDGFDEIDIECARWGNPTAPNLSYTVWPNFGSTEHQWTTQYTLSSTDLYTTHRCIRTPDSVVFQSMKGLVTDTTTTFVRKTSTHGVKALMPVHLNVWLFNGIPPSNEGEIEIIVHDFTYTP